MEYQGKPPYFDPKCISHHLRHRDIGRTPERPFMIFGALLDTELGDLISKVVFLSTLKQQFDYARLVVRYRAVRPYSAEVISLSPNMDHATPLKGQRPRWLARWLPDKRPWLSLEGEMRGTREGKRQAFYDLVVTGPMMDAQSVHGFKQPAILRIPPEREHLMRHRLIEIGLDPNRWYVTLHYRVGNYRPKARAFIRNSDPETYRQLTNYVIDELGGQVVQLGHPGMPAFPPRSGFVDLSRFENNFLLQAYAVCHSRFLVAGPSGPVALGWGFQVPTAVVDATDSHGGWGDAEQVILTHEVTTPEGQVLSNRALSEAGLLDHRSLARKFKDGENYRVRKNSVQELAAAARFLFERTQDVKEWRPARQQPAIKRPNFIIWPPQTHENLRFLVL